MRDPKYNLTTKISMWEISNTLDQHNYTYGGSQIQYTNNNIHLGYPKYISQTKISMWGIPNTLGQQKYSCGRSQNIRPTKISMWDIPITLGEQKYPCGRSQIHKANTNIHVVNPIYIIPTKYPCGRSQIHLANKEKPNFKDTNGPNGNQRRTAFGILQTVKRQDNRTCCGKDASSD